MPPVPAVMVPRSPTMPDPVPPAPDVGVVAWKQDSARGRRVAALRGRPASPKNSVVKIKTAVAANLDLWHRLIMLQWLADHWIWVTFFLASNALAGLWSGFQECWGPNPIKGWRDWNRYCDESNVRWAAILELGRREAERQGTELRPEIRSIESWHRQCLEGAHKLRNVTDRELLADSERPIEDWRPYGPPVDGDLPFRIGRKVSAVLRQTRRALMGNPHQRIR